MLEGFDDPQSMQIVIETVAEAPHLPIEFLFARVREWWMANVMCQRKRFGEVLVQIQRPGHRARDLRDFNGVRQPVAEVIGYSGRENLCLVLQPAKRPRVDYAIAVTLEFAAIGMRKFGVDPSKAPLNRKTQARQPVHRDNSLSKVIAARLTALRVLVRRGSTNFLARGRSVVFSRSASASVAVSLETSTVG